MQAVPQPYKQVSFQRGGGEIARFHFGAALKRPFVFPLVGPSGRSLTRLGKAWRTGQRAMTCFAHALEPSPVAAAARVGYPAIS
jgi:hypothetical protein